MQALNMRMRAVLTVPSDACLPSISILSHSLISVMLFGQRAHTDACNGIVTALVCN